MSWKPDYEPNRHRTIKLNAWLTVDEYLKLRKLAAKAHMTMREYMVSKCLPQEPKQRAPIVFVPRRSRSKAA